jgi:hypothetical protein
MTFAGELGWTYMDPRRTGEQLVCNSMIDTSTWGRDESFLER